MTTALLVALMVLLFSFQSLFTRLYSKAYAGKEKSLSTPVFSVCYGLFIALCSLAVNGFGFHASAATWLLGLVNAAVLLLYNTSMIRGGGQGSYAFLMLSSLFGGIVIPLLVGVVFLRESMSVLQWIAVIVMIAAIVLMNSRGLNTKEASRSYYLWCALLFLANGLYGTVMNLQVQELGGQESSEMLVILFACSALLAAAGEIFRGRGKALSGGFCMGRRAGLTAARLMLYLLNQMQSSLLFTINNGGVLALSFVYSVLLFKEKLLGLQVLGMLLAACSVVLINLG